MHVAKEEEAVKLVAVSPTILRGCDISPPEPVFDAVFGSHSSRPLSAFDATQQYGRVRESAVRPGPGGDKLRVLYSPGGQIRWAQGGRFRAGAWTSN